MAANTDKRSLISFPCIEEVGGRGFKSNRANPGEACFKIRGGDLAGEDTAFLLVAPCARSLDPLADSRPVHS